VRGHEGHVCVCSSYDNLVSMAPCLGAQSDDSQSKSVTVSEDNASKISKTTSATSGQNLTSTSLFMAKICRKLVFLCCM
jgi:hypothetical protein